MVNSSAHIQVQSSNISSSTDTDFQNPTSSTRSSTSPGELLIKFHFNSYRKRSTSAKKRRTALSAARSEVKALKENYGNMQKEAWKYKKRFQRMNQENNIDNSISSKTNERKENMTPKSKAHRDIREAGLTPRSMPKSIVRKLVMGNAVCAEIQEVVEKYPQQSKRRMII
ncbi:hypothetical protein DPMN_026741 [Dreissena polymorpha]|uniref:Uncharacterized protein n=1 Tax=Dreissena polymorpha TaxID=45954 RepID=A0A9D4LTY8_DREPO|nr:hypothetical protein DPMN_026741 [Dreissena polymorpha]